MTCAQFYRRSSPSNTAWLDTGDGHQVYWERCGNPKGSPPCFCTAARAVAASPDHRSVRPREYCVTLFDQRGCGLDAARLADANTTWHSSPHREAARARRRERWLVFGGSWRQARSHLPTRRRPERVRRTDPALASCQRACCRRHATRSSARPTSGALLRGGGASRGRSRECLRDARDLGCRARDCRRSAWHSSSIARLVLMDQRALGLAFFGAAEYVERRATQALELGEPLEAGQHERAELRLLQLALGVLLRRQRWREVVV